MKIDHVIVYAVYVVVFRALGTAIGALYHEDVRLSQRYIVLRSALGSREYHHRRSMGAEDNALVHVTVADMEHRFLQVQGKISLVKSAAASGGPLRSLLLGDGELVRGLCSQGNFYDAINLGISAANYSGEGSARDCPEGPSSIGRSPSLEQAISLLAKACSCPSSDNCSPTVDTISQFASTLGSNLTSLLEFEETSDAPKFLREYLVHCLQCLDGPTGNWSLHAAATAAALKSPSSSQGALSPALADSFSGFSSAENSEYVHVPRVSGLSGNVSALLLQLLEKGYLTQACDTASKVLDQAEPRAGELECIPYTVLDRLLHACGQVLTPLNSHSHSHSAAGAGGAGAQGQLKALAASHGHLVAALENYFNRLLVVEAGGGQ
jgi:hypothetical protein